MVASRRSPQSPDELILRQRALEWEEALRHRDVVYKQTWYAIQNSPYVLDDMVGYGWLGAIRAVRTFRANAGAKMQTWVSVCVGSEVRDAMRKLGRAEGWARGRERVYVNVMEPYAVETLADCPRPSIEEEELGFQSLISGLPAKLQQIATWYYVDDLTQEEIGERLGVTGPRISQLLTRARKQIQEQLAAA